MTFLRRLFEDLSGRSDLRLLDPILRQLDATLEGAHLAHQAVEGHIPSSAARDTMTGVEHRGDTERAALVHALAKTLTTPVDREDLFRISRSIDDVLDGLRDFVREMDLFDAAPAGDLAPVIDAVVCTTGILRTAVQNIHSGLSGVTAAVLEAKKANNEVRRLYQRALAGILQDPVTARTLQLQALLRRLDLVGIHLGEAADALADATLKRSH